MASVVDAGLSWNARKSDSLSGLMIPQSVGAIVFALSRLSFGSASAGQGVGASTAASATPPLVPAVPLVPLLDAPPFGSKTS